jgi:hypothetical protein
MVPVSRVGSWLDNDLNPPKTARSKPVYLAWLKFDSPISRLMRRELDTGKFSATSVSNCYIEEVVLASGRLTVIIIGSRKQL